MKHTFVRTPSGDIEINHIREMVAEMKNSIWEFCKWFPRPALIDNKSGSATHFYTGQHFDPKYFTLDEKGWNHDHCVVCFRSISNDANQQTETEGYYNGYDWVCKTCFEEFIQTDDLNEKLSRLEKYYK
ncbi:MAG: hypothetical protein INR69_13015 [Mucilaginibacter polytrichastri]|nr:hypothetical protein [Mucilaginibacter polytrichastri]